MDNSEQEYFEIIMLSPLVVDKNNLTHDMIMDTRKLTVSVISKDADFELFKRFGMGREIAVCIHRSAVSCLVAHMAVNADTVAVALCKNALILHIDELIFQRGAAGVDYEN